MNSDVKHIASVSPKEAVQNAFTRWWNNRNNPAAILLHVSPRVSSWSEEHMQHIVAHTTCVQVEKNS